MDVWLSQLAESPSAGGSLRHIAFLGWWPSFPVLLYPGRNSKVQTFHQGFFTFPKTCQSDSLKHHLLFWGGIIWIFQSAVLTAQSSRPVCAVPPPSLTTLLDCVWWCLHTDKLQCLSLDQGRQPDCSYQSSHFSSYLLGCIFLKESLQNNSGNCNAPAALYTKYSLWKMCQHHLHWIKSHVREDIKAWKSACIKKPKAWSHPKNLQTIQESLTELLRTAGGSRGSTIASQTPSAAAVFSRSCFQTVQTLTFLWEKATAQCWKSCLILSLIACQECVPLCQQIGSHPSHLSQR